MSTRFDFTGRTVLVTGAGQGIGAALAQGFLAAGARVAVGDLDTSALESAYPDSAGQVLRLGLDVSDASSVAAAIERTLGWSGTIDAVVNNAGIARDAMLWRLADEQWSTVLAVHLTGTFHVMRAVIPSMRAVGYGRIINVTSYTGLHGNIGQSNYAAAKAGIVGLTKTAAKELARSGITVNAVSPNAATAMVAGVPADKRRQLEEAIPAGRFAEPAEMFPAVAFLASEQAGYITGVVFPVDGGMAM